jgi:hypothetical protein
MEIYILIIAFSFMLFGFLIGYYTGFYYAKESCPGKKKIKKKKK